MTRPSPAEAAAFYFNYIDQVEGDDLFFALSNQLEEFSGFAEQISEEQSLHRYEPGKWSIRQVMNHVIDGERLFAFRAFWFARGLESALPSFDQDVAVMHSNADSVAWTRHVSEFQYVRHSTIAMFQSMPAEAWCRSGIASDNLVTVRALGYTIAGHFAHHMRILRERYL